MGCVSSKLIKKELKQEHVIVNNGGGGGGYFSHVVSLTSSTYGALRLDNDQPVVSAKPHEESEVITTINEWELMEGLEEGVPISNQPKKSPKSAPFLRGFMNSDTRSPLKFFNQLGSPKTLKKPTGKENRGGGGVRRLDYSNSPKGILKASNFSPNSCKNSSFPVKGSPVCVRRNSFGSDKDSTLQCSSQRKSQGPLFDPELVASYEKELTKEEEQVKRMVWATPKTRRARKSLDSLSLIQMFEKKCPPGGENSVVIYTTTLRGIRKTFEDCNKVRGIIESYCVRMRERDVSMDSGFKEELRKLMGAEQVKVPVVFVKGRLVGGADEVVKLEEEEKLGVLLEGIPRALGGCEGCGGVRFVMCVECNGSCKVLDEGKKKTVRCGKCNENGIMQCPICC